MLKTKLLVGVCLFAVLAYAQKEQNNWYFGKYAAISFETGTATPKFDNPQNTYGRTASISDPITGKLLFYTNSQQVWNYKHQLMVNGNIPSASPTGDMIIVPMPEGTAKYYLFFIGNIADLQYVIVDMNKNGGEGEVITTAKTISSGNTKQVTAVHHLYADAFWIITHQNNSNKFKAHFVDASGVSNQPVVSSVGLTSSNYGDMVASNQGNKLAVTNYLDNNYKAEVFDFDRICGVFSNPVELTTNPTWENAYGIAFSPDDSKLYITYSIQQSQLVQYYGNNYENSYFIAYSEQNFNIMRLGPDGRIYITTHDNGIPGERIDAILNPNEIATACNYKKDFLRLNKTGETKRSAQFELPAFATGKRIEKPIKDSLITAKGLCKGDTTFFSFNTKYNFDSLTWNFGDNTTPKTTLSLLQKHVYKNAQNYAIALTIYKCGMSFSLKDSIAIKEVPHFSIGNDTTLCSGGSIILVGPIGEKFLWSTGDSSSAITVNKSGKYSLKVNNGNCSGVDEINISYHPPLFIALGDEYTICDKDKELIKLDAGEGFATYKWTPTEDTTQWIIVGEVQDYFVVVKDYRGCDGSDGTTVKRRCPVTLYFPNSFSPNDDGINDVYAPVGVDVESFHLTIYNRWGQLVFESNNINDVWNGTLNHKPAPNDTYIYIAEYAGYLNKKLKDFNVKGNITLMR